MISYLMDIRGLTLKNVQNQRKLNMWWTVCLDKIDKRLCISRPVLKSNIT